MIKKCGHNFSLDFYCLGVFIYEIIAGFPPTLNSKKSPTFSKILKTEIKFPSHFSQCLKNLILRLLEQNPDKRLGSNGGVREVLAHDWFFPVSQETLFKKNWKTSLKPNVYNFYVDEEIMKKNMNFDDFLKENKNENGNQRRDSLIQKFEGFDVLFRGKLKIEKKKRNWKSFDVKREYVKEASQMINSPLGKPLAIHMGDSTDGEITE